MSSSITVYILLIDNQSTVRSCYLACHRKRSEYQQNPHQEKSISSKRSIILLEHLQCTFLYFLSNKDLDYKSEYTFNVCVSIIVFLYFRKKYKKSYFLSLYLEMEIKVFYILKKK